MWNNIKKMIEYPEEGITSKVLANTERNNITLFCMAKNSELLEHTSTREGFVYVIEGKGTFTREGEDIEMKEGVFIKMPKNAVHALKAKENMSFILSLVK